MRDYDMATPEVLLKDGEYRMQLDLLVGTDDEVADAFEAAADVIRRIQGTAKKDVAVEPTPGTQLLEWAQMLHSRWPVARRHLEALALWFDAPETPGDDFTPPAADVIRRIQGVEKTAEQTSRLRTDADYLRSDYPIAARYFDALADWLHGGSGDFQPPPADADAYADQLRYMADSFIQTDDPVAAQVARDLADWLHGRDATDFTPPAHADAIAAAERRGAKRRQALIVRFLREHENFVTASAIRESIERGDHLNGGESNDA